jgi:hypothetical protein
MSSYPRSVHRWLVAIAVMVPVPAIACSGPGAMEAIEAAEHRGWVMLAITAGIVGLAAGFAISRKRIGTAISMLPILALHPAIWFGARHGDCGHLLTAGSNVYLAVAPLACAMLYMLGVRRATRAADPERL